MNSLNIFLTLTDLTMIIQQKYFDMTIKQKINKLYDNLTYFVVTSYRQKFFIYLLVLY